MKKIIFFLFISVCCNAQTLINLDLWVGSPTDNNTYIPLSLNQIGASSGSFNNSDSYKIIANDGIFRVQFSFTSASSTTTYNIKCGFLNEYSVIIKNSLASSDNPKLTFNDITVNNAGTVLNSFGGIDTLNLDDAGGNYKTTENYLGNGLQMIFTKGTFTGSFTALLLFEKKKVNEYDIISTDSIWQEFNDSAIFYADAVGDTFIIGNFSGNSMGITTLKPIMIVDGLKVIIAARSGTYYNAIIIENNNDGLQFMINNSYEDKIDSLGNILPARDAENNLGNSAQKFKNGWFSDNVFCDTLFANVLDTPSDTIATDSDAATLLNFPAGKSGNPTGFLSVNVNGVTRLFPYW